MARNRQWVAAMSEDQIERLVALKVDRLDARFLNTAMTQAEYDAELRDINQWAEAEYRFAAAGEG